MESPEDKNNAARIRSARIQNKQSAEQLYAGIRKGSTKELSISITLLESEKAEDQEVAARLIDMCLPHSGHAVRIGISGVPGVGMVTLAMILQQLNLPVEGIALIIGIDRVLDMVRVAVNVTGNAAITCLVGKDEKQLDYNIFRSQR